MNLDYLFDSILNIIYIYLKNLKKKFTYIIINIISLRSNKFDKINN